MEAYYIGNCIQALIAIRWGIDLEPLELKNCHQNISLSLFIDFKKPLLLISNLIWDLIVGWIYRRIYTIILQVFEWANGWIFQHKKSKK